MLHKKTFPCLRSIPIIIYRKTKKHHLYFSINIRSFKTLKAKYLYIYKLNECLPVG